MNCLSGVFSFTGNAVRWNPATTAWEEKKKWAVSSHAVFYYLQYIIYITDDREPVRIPAVRTRGVQPGTCNEIRALSAGGDGFYPYVSSLLCFLV